MNIICKECVKRSGSPCNEIKEFIDKNKINLVNKEMLLYLMQCVQNNGGCPNNKKQKMKSTMN